MGDQPLWTQLLLEGQLSDTSHRLAAILQRLPGEGGVREALLATEDGLVVAQTGNRHYLAAVAGFLLAAARQACALARIAPARTITVEDEAGNLLICRSFTAGAARVALVLICQEEGRSVPTLDDTIRAIEQTVGS